MSRLYARRGYRSKVRPDDDDRNRLTLVATDREAVVGTLTVGFDAEHGLLADDLFPDEVNALRDAGREVCEFTKLAMDGLVHSQRALAAMFHVAFIHAHRLRGCDNLLIEVNPRHTRYYEAKLGFKVAGPERLNRRVEAPAVLLMLDLWYAQDQIDRFGGKPEMSSGERSLYPFGFSPHEEAGILGRLRAEHAARGRPGLA
ncbi:MAG: N-acetyltransferase [Burkholderiales bacterium]|nr:N-acetyltransferase [Burkholderiales bacterium]